MTDTTIASKVYMEPLTVEYLAKIEQAAAVLRAGGALRVVLDGKHLVFPAGQALHGAAS